MGRRGFRLLVHGEAQHAAYRVATPAAALHIYTTLESRSRRPWHRSGRSLSDPVRLAVVIKVQEAMTKYESV